MYSAAADTEMNPFLIMAFGAISSWVLLIPARAVLKIVGIVDRPNGRSSHSVPTVRGGGIALVAVIAAYVVGWLWWQDPIRMLCLLSAFSVLSVISFIDDLRGVGASIRFAIHGAAAVAGVIGLFVSYAQSISIAIVVVSLVATVWIAGYTNAFNFMDGINGIAGAQALVTGLGTAGIAASLGVPASKPAITLALVVAGASVGFLPHNFPKARVFMGDVGSAPLGFLLAVLAVWVAALTSWWVLFWIALLHSNFVLDTGITLLRRAMRGQRLSEAHREHFYQRLVRAGWSHTAVTSTEFGLQVVVGFLLWWATPGAPAVRVIVACIVVAIWLGFFAFAERVFNDSPAGANRA